MKDIIQEAIENTAIGTTTYYNTNSPVDRSRALIAARTIQSAVDLGYKVLVVDGGSYDEFLRSVETYCEILPENPRGMGSGRRQVIREAVNSGRKVIAWTEPEKESYIPELWKTVVPILEGNADLVFPKRHSLADYPSSQQYAEMFGNLTLTHLTGIALDYWFGPKTWNSAISHHILDYKSDYGDKWDSILFPFLQMIHKDVKTLSIPVDYKHPRQQTQDEETNVEMDVKRFTQLQNLLPTAINFWRNLKNQ